MNSGYTYNKVMLQLLMQTNYMNNTSNTFII